MQHQALETLQDPMPCNLHNAPSTLNDRRPLPLRRWQRKEKSGSTNLDLIEEGDPEAVTTITMETTVEPPGQGRRSLLKAKEKDQPYLARSAKAELSPSPKTAPSPRRRNKRAPATNAATIEGAPERANPRRRHRSHRRETKLEDLTSTTI
jgi:hypothetical protein